MVAAAATRSTKDVYEMMDQLPEAFGIVKKTLTGVSSSIAWLASTRRTRRAGNEKDQRPKDERMP